MSIGIGGQRIITKGLCGAACEGLITTQFSLYCINVVVPPIVGGGGGGGGPYPENMGAQNQVNDIQDFFTPVKEDFYDPSRFPRYKKEVIIRVELGNFHMEKIYMVRIEKADTIVTILNFANISKARVKVAVSTIRKKMNNMRVLIKHLTRKRTDK